MFERTVELKKISFTLKEYGLKFERNCVKLHFKRNMDPHKRAYLYGVKFTLRQS